MTSDAAVISSRMDRKKEETKQKIINTAMELFRKQGFENTTMEQIAAEADIAKGTLYNYFPVKEAILDENMKRAFREGSAERIERLKALPDTRARIAGLLKQLIGGVQAQPVIFEKYFAYRIRQMISLTPDESAKSGLHALEAEIIAMGQRSGEIRTDLPFELLTGFFEFVFIEVAQQFYRDPDGFDADTIIQQTVDLFMHGAEPS